MQFFPNTKYLDYAVTVEEYTLQKSANLVLNVDGCIGALFLDLLVSWVALFKCGWPQVGLWVWMAPMVGL